MTESLNRRLGWTLLVIAFAWAVWLDPWTLSERDPAALVGSPRMAARHAQAVLLGMAFLQMVIGQLLAMERFRMTGPLSAQVTAAGAVVYALGYVLRPLWAGSGWLILVGALANFLGFALLSWESYRIESGPVLRVVLPVIAFGMLMDLGVGLSMIRPGLFLPSYIGPEDGVRLRMLRLARVAAIALSVLALLYEGLAARTGPEGSTAWVLRWGRIGLLAGAAGMPAVLATACFTSVDVKYLLPLPANAVVLGTLIGAWLARKHGRPLEFWGWVVVAASMGVGMVIGGYAFDGPLPAPEAMTAYNDHPRRLLRLGHAYAIILGLLWIMAARPRDEDRRDAWVERLGVPVLVAGSLATLGMILLAGVLDLAGAALAAGPALLTAGLILCPGIGRGGKGIQLPGGEP
jgi:hypothetical protein